MDKLFSLSKKIAIVTGAARGNGKAIAMGFLGAEAVVYFVDILEKELLKTVRGLKNRNARFIVADLTKKEDLQKIVGQVYKNEKRIDVLVNNAGVGISGPSEIYGEEDWEKTYAVNLRAPFLLSQLAAKHMIKKRSGVIINLTSLNSEQGFPNSPANVSAKGGLRQLTKALALDWGKYNIRVNNLGPGYIKTLMNKKSWSDRKLRLQRTNRTILGRWGTPEDLVGPAIFLASDASRYMTGQDLYIDGGWLAKGL